MREPASKLRTCATRRTISAPHSTLSVLGYGATVAVDVSDPLLVDKLSTFLPPHVEISNRDDDDAPDVSLITTSATPRYWVRLGERTIGWSDEIDLAFWWVANAISYLIATHADMTFVHAGVVEIGGGAVILPGRSRWGKSSLVAALVERGCGYMSDEYAVITPNAKVLPFAAPIRLRGDSGARHWRPDSMSNADGLRCDAVIVTRFKRGANWHPSPLSPGLMAMSVLRHSMASRERPGRALDAASALAKLAVGFESPRGEAGPTADAIISLLVPGASGGHTWKGGAGR